MNTELIFKGKTLTTLWQNFTLQPTSGDPPSEDGYPLGTNGGANSTIYDINTPITWDPDTSLPSSLLGTTVTQIENLGILDFSLSLEFIYTILSGEQGYDCSSVPTINLNAYDGTGNFPGEFFTANLASKSVISLPSFTVPYCVGSNCPTFTYTPPPVEFGNISKYIIQAVPYNVPCTNYGVRDFALQVEMRVTLTVFCNTIEDLQSSFCLSFCTTPSNLQTCYNSYEQFCLTKINPSDQYGIFTVPGCFTYFSDYLGNGPGPNSSIDTYLDIACSGITGLNDFTNSSGTVQTVCACHLDEKFYDNLRTSLANDFPDSRLIDIPEVCLFPPCVSSVFKPVSVGKVCPLPACINIASITNNGSVGGKVIINQSDKNCVDASKAGSSNGNGNGNRNGNGNPPAKSWIENNWLWLILGIGLLIAFIIVIIIIISTEDKPKPKPKDLDIN